MMKRVFNSGQRGPASKPFSLRAMAGVPLAMLIAGLLLFTACGGSGSNAGGGGTVGTEAASGTVVLPAGFTPKPASLSIATATGSTSLGSDSSFTVTEPAGGGAATVLLTDAAGNIVLLGHVDTADPAFNEISATSTAEELLFVGSGAFTTPQSVWPDIYRLLAAAPETATLAGVISTRVAANPTAVGDLDPVIIAALETALASLMPDPHNIETTAAQPRPVRTAPRAEAAGATAKIDVKATASATTPDPQWGIVASPSDDHLGLILTNQSRLNRFYFVYLTGTIPAGKTFKDPPEPEKPWTMVNSGLLRAVSGASGTILTIGDYVYGKYTNSGKTSTYAAENTPTLALPITPPDAIENTYQVYVVGMGSLKVPDPKDLADNADAAMVRQTQVNMCYYQAMKEMAWPLLTKVLPLSKNTDIWDDPSPIIKAIGTFIKQAGNVGLAWQQDTLASPGQAWDSTKTLLKAAFGVGQGTAKDALVGLLNTINRDNVISADTISKLGDFTGRLLYILKITDGIVTASDIALMTWEGTQSNEYNIWDVTAAAPALALIPESATLSTSLQTAPFSVKTTGYLPATLTYIWGPSAYGTFQTPCLSGDKVTCVGSQTAIYCVLPVGRRNFAHAAGITA